jgi:transposase-like protein
MSIFTKDKNPGAYRGNLNCPVCQSSAIRFVENVTPHRLRYRCRKCGLPFQYDISNSFNHPYAAWKKPKWQEIVESSAYREKT